MTTHPSIEAALMAAQADFPALLKDNTAEVVTTKGKYSYRYADLPSILQAIVPVLRNHGIVQFQRMDVRDGFQLIVTELRHEAGRLESVIMVPVDGAKPQEIGSAITFLRRYSLVALLGVATDEDDDAASANRPRPARASPAQRPERRAVGPDDHAAAAPGYRVEGATFSAEAAVAAYEAIARDRDPRDAERVWINADATADRNRLYRERPDLKARMRAARDTMQERLKQSMAAAS